MSDTWLTRLRFLVGTGAFAWEVVWDKHERLWVVVIAIWLLGAPIEDLIKLLTSGRIQIRIPRADDEKEDE